MHKEPHILATLSLNYHFNMYATVPPSPGDANSMPHDHLRNFVFSALSPYGLRSSCLKMLSKSLQATRNKARCTFFGSCIEEHVIPRTISGLWRFNGLEHPFASHTKASLLSILRSQVHHKEGAYFAARQAWRQFFDACPPHLVETCSILGKRHLEFHNKDDSVGQRNKLHQLIKDSPWSKAPLLECVTNLSSHTLTTTQHQVLGLGISFALPPRADTMTDFIIGLNNLHKYAKDIRPELHTLRGMGLSILQNLELHSTGLPKRFMTAIQELKANKNILISKADKGNQIVILDIDFYHTKGEEMLSDTRVYKALSKNLVKK